MNPAKARSNCPTQSKLQLPTVPRTAMTGDFLLAQSATSCHYAADKVIISFTRQQLQKACRTFVGRGLVKSQDVEAAPQQSCLFS